MANPNQPGLTLADVLAPPDPPNPDEIRQIQLLAEARLRSFTANPAALPPFGTTTLRWDIIMPTTVIPGVQVEVHLSDGVVDDVVDSAGSRVMAPFGDTTYFLFLKTPLAARQLGTLTLSVDFATCRLIDIGSTFFKTLVKREADKTFPAAGQVTLRGDGAKLDIGIDSFVIDIPVEAEVPNWFNADIDVTMGFSLSFVNGRIRVVHDVATTNVSFGVLSGLLSAGCTVAVAKALEAQSDGFLTGLVGPVIADRIARTLTDAVDELLKGLNNANPPIPFKFYNLTLTEVGMTCRFCPATPAPSLEDHGPLDGTLEPVLG